jgi:hypothetical protein
MQAERKPLVVLSSGRARRGPMTAFVQEWAVELFTLGLLLLAVVILVAVLSA